ncbi:unnamed protein product [Brassicogethes aeneus]|uniref:acid phosphatase n=1 Tax=Brassicogethes aeneus TaxID=1431903 RepID=A0A9P0BC43_BRAAE|nr:unnamed protein product [Brassicogethes aeneus]
MSENINTLKLIHVLFRHGNRTNVKSTCFPNDPYISETYHPYGRGQLTKAGKQNCHNLGKYLRKRYENYLGEYNFNTVEAFSTDMPRTKMSLQMVLAGLFPPSADEAIDNLNWQPIPYNYKPVSDDKLLFGVCQPEHREELDKIEASAEVQAIYEKNKDLIAYINQHTGKKYTEFFSYFDLYTTFLSEEEWGFELEEWTKTIYPNFLKSLAIQFFMTLSKTDKIRKYGQGNFLKKIIDECKAKMEGVLSEERKIYLYSGHDINITQFLGTLDLFEPHMPPYCACVILELHEINGEYGLKIFYQDYKQEDPKLMKLPGCQEFCPLDKFVEIHEKYLPE